MSYFCPVGHGSTLNPPYYRGWVSIKPAVNQYIVFAGMLCGAFMRRGLTQCRFSVGTASQTIDQCGISAWSPVLYSIAALPGSMKVCSTVTCVRQPYYSHWLWCLRSFIHKE